MTDRRDRDELTDRDDLTAKCLAVLRESHKERGDWNGDPYEEHPYQEANKDWFWETGAQELAVALLAAGWVHWSLHPTVEKLTADLQLERELHRDTCTDNSALRRRLVEAGAVDEDFQ